MTNPSTRTKRQALKALAGMAEVVGNEMLEHGIYCSADVVNQKLAKAGAICGGHRACAVGSLFLGAGADPYETRAYAAASDRVAYLQRRPGLRLAYDTLNATAEEIFARELRAERRRALESDYTEPGDVDAAIKFVGAMEWLFEEGALLGPKGRENLLRSGIMLASGHEQRKLLKLIDVARQRIEVM